jgi:hypothetical protein
MGCGREKATRGQVFLRPWHQGGIQPVPGKGNLNWVGVRLAEPSAGRGPGNLTAGPEQKQHQRLLRVEPVLGLLVDP